jgi:HPt (histidine-containing phosphotransfer) domain-containing protein
MDATALPLVPGLTYALTDCLNDIHQGRRDGQTLFVQEAASRLAGKAEIFGLVRLGKLARCVERAAEADDIAAVSTVIEDLEPVVGRYIEAIRGCFQSFMDHAR